MEYQLWIFPPNYGEDGVPIAPTRELSAPGPFPAISAGDLVMVDNITKHSPRATQVNHEFIESGGRLLCRVHVFTHPLANG